jgi:hypothetical protein
MNAFVGNLGKALEAAGDGTGALAISRYLEFFSKLAVKFEPFLQLWPRTPVPVIRGGEWLGTDREGRSFVTVIKEAASLGIREDLPRLAYAAMALASTDLLARVLLREGVVGGMTHTLNLDHELLSSPSLFPVLRRFVRPGFHPGCTLYEVNEHCKSEDVTPALNLSADTDLGLALDDSDKASPLLRVKLARVCRLAKLDAFTTIPLMADRGHDPERVMQEILRHRISGCPFVVEGIEKPEHLDFVSARWREEWGELWGQGYAVGLTGPFPRIFRKGGPGAYYLRNPDQDKEGR